MTGDLTKWLEDGLQPWQANPLELVSWLDMLQFSAGAFLWCGSALQQIRQDCMLGALVCIEEKPGIAYMKDLDGKGKETTLERLPSVEKELRKINLLISAETVNDLIAELRSESRHNFQWLSDQMDNIERLVQKELKSKCFLYIPPERMRFWPTADRQNIFGDDVANKFPSASFDIGNSGVCLATRMPTAAVFHLMRALEIALAVMGKPFGVSLEHTNWAPAIDEIGSRIRDMHKEPKWKALPDCKELQGFYSQAASHFVFLKDAWRNHTMHARAKYTDGEGEKIFENVKGFMQKLAERLSE